MVDLEVIECKKKFIRLLQCIKPQDLIKDDTFFEKIQSYLSYKEYNDFLKDPDVMNWIEGTVNALNNDDSELIPSQQVASFTLKLLCFICSNEWDFVAIQEKGLLDKIQLGLQKHPQLKKASIKLNHLQLLRAISTHSIGLHWIKQSKIWNLIIGYFVTNSTIYIMREASLFLFEVLTKFSELMKDENSCINALEAVIGPIITYKENHEQSGVTIDDENFMDEYLPHINMTSELLLLCIEANRRTRLAYLILLKFRYENKLWFVQDSVHSDKTFLAAVCRSHNIANIARLSCMDIPVSDTKAADLTSDNHAVHFYNLINYCITRRIFRNINMVTEQHHQLWYKLGDRAPNDVVLEYHDLKFGDQVILIQSFPVLHVIQTRYKANNEYINQVCTKMFNKSCEHTIRFLYQYRDALEFESFDFITDLASNSIQSIVASKKYLKRDRAILAFQILVHILKGYAEDPSEAKGNNHHELGLVQLVLQAPNLLSTLLNAINEMIITFKFNWKECLESTVIVPLLLTLLENPNLTSRHAVEAFKLIQTSIEHFLAPNMALLMDKIEESGMENLGPTIFKRLHDISWEVRDSVLELVHSIVEISNEKFPPFQAHLLQHKICQTVEIIARNDSEPYVRASALKALAAMIKIKLFWEHTLHSLDVKKYAVETLANESEGVVRREAVACIASIYNYQQIPEMCLDVIFSVLAHCAVNDFYWEAKVNALEFWKLVICRQFQHQGMIDGTFPAVTFSKEHRKIITLNEKEIHLRLRKVLNELSLRGCLGILISCLQDSDLEVLKKTCEIVEKVMGYLNKYNYIEEYRMSKSSSSQKVSIPVIDSNYADFKSLVGTKDTEVRNTADVRKNTEVCMSVENGEICSIDTVIDSIVQSSDLSLLSHNCKENLKLNRDHPCNTGKIDENLFKKFAQVSADDFLNYITSHNLQQLVKDKSEWLQHSETFSTLLDDILQSFGEQNIDLDCY